jgi:hypothetical protein
VDCASATPQGWNSLCLRGSILVDCFDEQPWRGVTGLVRYIKLYHGPGSFGLKLGGSLSLVAALFGGLVLPDSVGIRDFL